MLALRVKVQEVVDVEEFPQCCRGFTLPNALISFAPAVLRFPWYAVVHTNLMIRSISDTRQVVGQFLHHGDCLSRLDCFWVVCDEDGLFCLHNYDAFLSLDII
jgi:hypothetical protein